VCTAPFTFACCPQPCASAVSGRRRSSEERVDFGDGFKVARKARHTHIFIDIYSCTHTYTTCTCTHTYTTCICMRTHIHIHTYIYNHGENTVPIQTPTTATDSHGLSRDPVHTVVRSLDCVPILPALLGIPPTFSFLSLSLSQLRSLSSTCRAQVASRCWASSSSCAPCSD
jgi:hypothetical protein